MIARMKKILLAGKQTDKNNILQILQEIGVVHIEPVNASAVKSLQNINALNKEIEKTQLAINLLSSVKVSESNIAPPGTPTRLVDEIYTNYIVLNRVENDILQLNNQIQQVEPWGKISAEDIEKLQNAGLYVEFIVAPSGYNFNQIPANLICKISEKNKEDYILAISKSPIPDSTEYKKIPIPKNDVYVCKTALSNLLEEKKRIIETFQEMAKRLPDIRKYYFELLDKKSILEVESGLLEEENIFVLKGWIPEEEESNLLFKLEQSKFIVAVQISQPTDDDFPPTKFSNPWWCSSVEVLFSILGVFPGYREVDISPVFFPAIVLFSSFLIGDAVYGIAGFMVVMIASKVFKNNSLPKELYNLFATIFVGTFLFGLFTNTWLGEQIPILQKLCLLPESPEEASNIMKKLCFTIGAIHIAIAHLWKILRSNISLNVLAELGWLLFILPMYWLVLSLVLGEQYNSFMIPMFTFSICLIVLFTNPSLNIISTIGYGLGALALNAASFLSDIISYIRLWAVGFAGSILAKSFNDLAKPLPYFLMLIILFIAHSVNFALGLVALFAHGVRLNLLEFSNHLGMEWTGREYAPFKKNQSNN